METQGILADVETLVSNQLQVVSYKWLSRNYSVLSNYAKRLLREFAEIHGDGLEVVYSLSGRLKSNPEIIDVMDHSFYLAEAKEEFDGNCSVRIYSVQPSIPKDPATIWNGEFVQAEELHLQTPTVINCLRDNRSIKVQLAHQGTVKQQQNKGEQSTQKVGLQAPKVLKDVKSESNSTRASHQLNKHSTEKETVLHPVNNKKVQTDKSSSAFGGSLENLCGRSAVNSKSNSTAEIYTNPTNTGASADAQICAREAESSAISDDDDQDVNFKRASSSEVSRKRRVILDFSDEDECEDAANLASRECLNENLYQVDKESSKTLVPHESNLNIGKQAEDKPEVKENISVYEESNPRCGEDSTVVSKDKSSGTIENTNKSGPKNNPNKWDKLASAAKTQRDAGIILTEKKRNSIPESDVNEVDKLTNGASRSPQRRKVLKTRIDEHGREVTEVVWEGKESEVKGDDSTTMKIDSSAARKADSSTTKKPDNTATNVTRRPRTAQKLMANTGPETQTAQAGGKKAAKKDPKQGSIMSFFKKA